MRGPTRLAPPACPFILTAYSKEGRRDGSGGAGVPMPPFASAAAW